MTEKTYQIVFSGQTVEGIDPARVKVNLSKLYKTDISKIEKLFQGKPVILKKNLDEDAALKYLTALKSAGAIGKLEEMPFGAENEGPDAAKTAAPPAPDQARSGAPEAGQTPAPVTIQTGAFSDVTVAPPGEVIMTHPKIEPPVIDTSGMDMAPVGEDLVERQTIAAPDIDISSLSMAAVGETLVEKPEVEPFEPDLSDIDMAPVGSDIGPEKKEPPPPPPDTSHISLKEEK